MQQTSGFLIVKRTICGELRRIAGRHPPNDGPLSGLTGIEIARMYRGFGGEFWPELADWSRDYFNLLPSGRACGLAPLFFLPLLEEFAQKMMPSVPCEIIYLQIGKNAAHPEGLPEDFQLLGFDLGYYESEYANLSAIHNDVIFGHFAELVDFQKSLNQSLLLDSEEDALGLLDMREHLHQNGANLECLPGYDFVPMAVFGKERAAE